MKKKLLVINTAIMLGLSSVFAIPGANAESSIQDMNKKKDLLQQKRSVIQSGILNADKEIKSLQDQQDSLENQISRIANTINDTAQKILEKNKQIKDTQAEIAQLEKEIAILKERIQKRNEILKERAVSFQESGGDTNYLEVLLGSRSFSDFISRVSAVSTIVEADQEILKQHEADKKELEEKQAAIEKKLSDLQNMLTDLEGLRSQLTKQKQEKDVLMKKLQIEEQDTQDEKMSLEEEEETLSAQETAIQKAIEMEQNRQKELEAARKRAAAQAKAREKSQARKNTNSNEGRSIDKVIISPAPTVSSGSFTRPTEGVVTSKMGARWNKLHAGLDIAKGGTVPIVAAADGVVMRSYVSSTYGNAVMISHSINGQVYTTVYAHMRSRNVSTGQVVKKGQQIGIMGNTGRSFGQHLHFEVHKGAWNVSKSNAVNPLNYVSY